MERIPFRHTVLFLGILLLTAMLFACTDSPPIVKNVNIDTFQGPQLHVVSFNMLHPGPFGAFSEFDGQADATFNDRLHILRDEILALMPDVVILQEVSDTGPCRYENVLFSLVDELNNALAATGVSYNSVYSMSNGDPIGITNFEEGNGILSRYEILEAEKTIYQVQFWTIIRESRSALRVTLRGALGNIDVIGTHLNGSPAADNVTELVEVIIPMRGNDNPIIVAGDYNSSPDSEAVQNMLDGGFIDTWDMANPGEDGFTCGRESLTDPNDMQTERIDYLFVSDENSVVSSGPFLDEAVYIDHGPGESWLFASDHTGIYSVVVPAGYE